MTLRRLLENGCVFLVHFDLHLTHLRSQVVDRLSHYRGTIREAAGAHIALFQLGVGDGCKARVKALQDNDVYVYPGEWGTTEKGEVSLTIS